MNAINSIKYLYLKLKREELGLLEKIFNKLLKLHFSKLPFLEKLQSIIFI